MRAPAVLTHETKLTRLAIADDSYFETVLTRESSNLAESQLDAKTHALVRVGALIAIGATPPGYMWSVESARRHGATDDEIVGCLIAALPAVGIADVVSAAPRLALALGYDVSAALEDSGTAISDGDLG
jgi:alkylhydroperoxidase/carboxymuconolactone decarboxylase family protein YurZ